MTQKLPCMNPAGVKGFLWVDGRSIRTEFPEWPQFNQTVSLDGIPLGHLINQLLDQEDAERAQAKR